MIKKESMGQYYDLLRDILETGEFNESRTGVDCRSVFGRSVRFDLSKGFPLLPGKHTSFKLIATELLWFLSGSTNNEDLRSLVGNNHRTIWEEWVDSESGWLGPIYGKQWRGWSDDKEAIGQIDALISGLKRNPSSRRHIVSAWNVSDLPDESLTPQQNVALGRMSLAPCHYSFQMNVSKGGRLSCLVNIRSSDTFLGLPYNIASYALLTHMIASLTDLSVGDLIVNIGNAHIYSNHLEQTSKLLSRDLSAFPLPTLIINRKVETIDDFKLGDFTVADYLSYSSIPAPVAV